MNNIVYIGSRQTRQNANAFIVHNIHIHIRRVRLLEVREKELE